MKKLILLLSLLFSGFAFGQQNTLTTTTLSSAVSLPSATSNGTLIIVASATGITKNTTGIYVDREFMQVNAVSGTLLTVTRGYANTRATTHLSGATVYVGSLNLFQAFPKNGSCTLANELVQPWIDVTTGYKYWCTDSLWVADPNFPSADGAGITGRFRYTTVPVGSVAYSGFGNDTTLVAGTFYCADVVVQRDITATGIAVLTGGTNGAASTGLIALYSAGGALIANSASAGAVTNGSVNTFQQRAFTATVTLRGPAEYFACYQQNNATDTLRTVAASTFPDVLTTSFTGVFSTIPATITVPTTFTANVGPIAYVY
jgi:hypothetical protein